MQQTLTVSQFLDQINDAIGGYSVAVEGEVSDFRINQNQWIFFDIKDEDATLNCFMVKYRLAAPLEDGMKVVVFGRPSVYKKFGKFSLTVEHVEVSGEGDLKRQYELLKAQLAKEGLFDAARKRTITRYPRRIGLITSRDAAAYADFIKVLGERFGGIEIYLKHVHVQGERAVNDVVAAFDTINALSNELDAVVLIRGGGSLEDLQAFNSEPVARAVFASRFPVVCGVGHEPDESLADFVADVRASTPSNAAELLIPHRRELEMELATMSERLEQALENTIDRQRQVIDRFERASDAVLAYTGRMLERINHTINSGIVAVATYLNAQQERVRYSSQLLQSLNPEGVLARGYALATKNGIVIKDAAQLKANDLIALRFAKGATSAKVVTQSKNADPATHDKKTQKQKRSARQSTLGL